MSSQRNLVKSGSEWETKIGYAKAVRSGQWVFVSGTGASRADGQPIGGTDAGKQARDALRRIGIALNEAGARFEDVVRTRVFLTDITQWEAVGHAHGEVFAQIQPAHTMIEVSKLIDPSLLVEIEVDALVD
ncbi:RidA family protein [Rhodococcus koreensis]